MDIEYLSEFVVIAKLGSFSRAAEELCISQSSLSKHILALERELGVTLLVRNSRSVTLSPVGAQILGIASQISELKEELISVTHRHTAREKTALSIASIPVMAQYNITGLMADFQTFCPDISLEVTECERQELHDLLETGKCELAITRWGLEPEEELTALELCRDHLVAVVSKDHAFAGRDTLSLSQLAGQNLLFLDQQTGFHHLYSSLCRSAGFLPNIAFTGHRPENIIDLAARNMGVALLMDRHVSHVRAPDVVTIPLEPRVESTICLVRRTGHKPTALARKFWDFAAAWAGTDSRTE